MAKVYRPSVRYDARYKEYVDRVKEATGLDGAQIIRLALFTAAENPEFAERLKRYTDGVLTMPQPKWNKEDDNMWLLQQGEEDMPASHGISSVIDSAVTRTEAGGIVIKIG